MSEVKLATLVASSFGKFPGGRKQIVNTICFANGEKFKVTSMEQKDDSTEYTIEYGKVNRIYSEFQFTGSGVTESKNYNSNSENIQFKDQALRDVIYSSLIKKVPNLKDMENKFVNLQKGAVSTKVTIKPGTTELRINNAVKNLIYDEDEVIIHK